MVMFVSRSIQIQIKSLHMLFLLSTKLAEQFGQLENLEKWYKYVSL